MEVVDAERQQREETEEEDQSMGAGTESTAPQLSKVDVSEVYSPPRIVPVAESMGLIGGTSFDLTVVDEKT